MHPGNILVRATRSKTSHKQIFRSRPHIILLDVGMTAELCKKDRVNLLDFFKAVALRDGHTAAESTLRLSKQQNCPNPRAFIEVMHLQLSFCVLVIKKLRQIFIACVCFWKKKSCIC
jgi:aarF domain-containing kinase